MADQNTIELNGKQYDAVSGRMVPEEGESKVIPIPVKRTIDGVIGTVRPHPRTHRTAPKLAREPQHSKTLLRSAVKKPHGEQPILSRTFSPARRERLAHLIEHDLKPKIANSGLVEKAREIKQSDFVSRFGTPKASRLEVNKPQTNQAQPAIPEAYQKNLERLAEQESDPDAHAFSEAALELSNSYKPLIRKRKGMFARMADSLHMSVRTMFISIIILVVLIGGGFSVYHFFYNLNVYYDDIHLHLRGHLPGTTVAGFSISSVQANKETLTINYHSNSDQRAYSVSEQNTNWDSATLLSAVVQPSVGSSYNTAEVGGRTVYYFNKSAAWVDGGIYFRVDYNSSNLSNDQVSSVINSL